MHSSFHLVVWLFVIMVNTECIKIITFLFQKRYSGTPTFFVCAASESARPLTI